MRRVAIIGDVHGCIGELKQLLELISKQYVDAVYHLGDLVDRGPDSGAVVSLLRRQGIKGVMGNHEYNLLSLRKKPWNRLSTEAQTTLASMSVDPSNWKYLADLPKIQLLDDVLNQPVVLVHGGLWPGVPLWKQPSAVLYAQLINPLRPGDAAWFNDAGAKARGLVPWQQQWDGQELVVYGHTVYREPTRIGRTLGIDTGCVYGGSLTALILPDFNFVTVRAARPYVTRANLYREE